MLSGGASRLIFGMRKRDLFWDGGVAQNHKVFIKNTLGVEKKSEPAIRREVFGAEFQSRFRGSESTTDLVLDFIPRNATDSPPQKNRMPLITGATFQPDFGVRKIG